MKKRILLVDDDAELRSCTSMILQGSGYAVSEAGSGNEGLEILRNEHIDLVISDFQMTNGDGATLFRGIMKLPHRTPLIFFTSEEPSYVREKSGDAKLTVLVKPQGVTELREAIRALLNVPSTAGK